MKTFLECWQSVAAALFSQALAGEPALEKAAEAWRDEAAISFCAEIEGDLEGEFTVLVAASALESPLVGEGIDPKASWEELLREVSEATAGKLLAESNKRVRVAGFRESRPVIPVRHAFRLVSSSDSWQIGVADGLHARFDEQQKQSSTSSDMPGKGEQCVVLAPGTELLVDVELEATLRFGCREMQLNEVMDLGPGDVIELDRQVADPVDLIVGDKIVARGEVVLVNGNFGLRVSEVAEPRKRLESVRCLF